jgi:hypothetical protein
MLEQRKMLSSLPEKKRENIFKDVSVRVVYFFQELRYKTTSSQVNWISGTKNTRKTM